MPQASSGVDRQTLNPFSEPGSLKARRDAMLLEDGIDLCLEGLCGVILPFQHYCEFILGRLAGQGNQSGRVNGRLGGGTILFARAETNDAADAVAVGSFVTDL